MKKDCEYLRKLTLERAAALREEPRVGVGGASMSLPSPSSKLLSMSLC